MHQAFTEKNVPEAGTPFPKLSALLREVLVVSTRMLSLKEVKQMTGLSTSTIYALMERGLFPRPRRVGRRAVRWVEQEVLDYLARCPKAGPRRRK